MADTRLMLDYVFDHEAAHPDAVLFTQPQAGGAVIDYSWREVVDQARRMASYLTAQNFEPGARIAILSKNSAHFIIAELAIWMSGATTVAIFPTETAEMVGYVLDHSGASLLFVGKLDEWAHQSAGIPAGLPCIALPLSPPTDFPSWDSIIARHTPLSGRLARRADELAMLVYTSGSTGKPKGVMQTFESVSRVGEYIAETVRNELGPGTPLRGLSYLPLAHVYERAWVECAFLVDGRGQLFFAETLETFLRDLQRARPTLFASVPRLWLRFQLGVFQKMPPRKLDVLLSVPIVGRLVAREVLAGLGLDHVKLAGSGSAPIPADLIAWYRRLGLNLCEGYGMTEDFGYSHSSTKQTALAGHVGTACKGVKVRISDDGEVQVLSVGRMKGYYKQPELDAEVFTADGYFCTGDLGELDAAGRLKITGRKKELFKTAKGKYVAPAPIENRINASPMIELSLVSGVGKQAAYAMVVLAEGLRLKLNNPDVRATTAKQLGQLLCKVNEDLADYERLRMIVVAQDPWTIENGCLTPTQKIKRNRIEALLADRVDSWFANPDPVQWA